VAFLIGMFLRGATAANYGETQARQQLGSVTVARVMNTNPVAVESGLPIQGFIDDNVYPYHRRWFPVVDDGMVVGSVATPQAVSIDWASWPTVPASRIMSPISADDVISPEASAFAALTQMRRPEPADGARQWSIAGHRILA
jgi:hypothetical protein